MPKYNAQSIEAHLSAVLKRTSARHPVLSSTEQSDGWSRSHWSEQEVDEPHTLGEQAPHRYDDFVVEFLDHQPVPFCLVETKIKCSDYGSAAAQKPLAEYLQRLDLLVDLHPARSPVQENSALKIDVLVNGEPATSVCVDRVRPITSTGGLLAISPALNFQVLGGTLDWTKSSVGASSNDLSNAKTLKDQWLHVGQVLKTVIGTRESDKRGRPTPVTEYLVSLADYGIPDRLMESASSVRSFAPVIIDVMVSTDHAADSTFWERNPTQPVVLDQVIGENVEQWAVTWETLRFEHSALTTMTLPEMSGKTRRYRDIRFAEPWNLYMEDTASAPSTEQGTVTKSQTAPSCSNSAISVDPSRPALEESARSMIEASRSASARPLQAEGNLQRSLKPAVVSPVKRKSGDLGLAGMSSSRSPKRQKHKREVQSASLEAQTGQEKLPDRPSSPAMNSRDMITSEHPLLPDATLFEPSAPPKLEKSARSSQKPSQTGPSAIWTTTASAMSARAMRNTPRRLPSHRPVDREPTSPTLRRSEPYAMVAEKTETAKDGSRQIEKSAIDSVEHNLESAESATSVVGKGRRRVSNRIREQSQTPDTNGRQQSSDELAPTPKSSKRPPHSRVAALKKGKKDTVAPEKVSVTRKKGARPVEDKEKKEKTVKKSARKSVKGAVTAKRRTVAVETQDTNSAASRPAATRVEPERKPEPEPERDEVLCAFRFLVI